MFVPIRDAVIIGCATEATIRRWARTGKLDTQTSDDGEPMYDLHGLVDLEAQNREAATRHAYRKLARYLLNGA